MVGLRFVLTKSLVAGAVALCLPSAALANEPSGGQFYIGAEIGWNWDVNADGGTTSAGGLFNGTLHHIDLGDGVLAGVALGYRASNLLRYDLTYTYLRGDADWTGAFGSLPIRPSSFSSRRESSVFLANAYLHARGLWPSLFQGVDPFVGAALASPETS